MCCKLFLDHSPGEKCEVKYVHVRGTLFFSSTRKFVNWFNVSEDPATVILDFKDALIIDHSAVAAIQGLSHRFAKKEKRVLLTNLPEKSHKRLHRTGNHAMLKQQITSQSNLDYIAEEADEENQAKTNGRSSASLILDATQASTEPLERVDEFGYGEKLSHLHIFQNPIDPVESEIALLGKDQGSFSIHSIKDKDES